MRIFNSIVCKQCFVVWYANNRIAFFFMENNYQYLSSTCLVFKKYRSGEHILVKC